MLRIRDLTYRIGRRTLLKGAEATINPGHRVGLVGRNGAGKTTLLRLITGALEPDEGKIEIPPRWRVGITSQEAPGGQESLIETVIKSDRELIRLQKEAETATDPERIAEIHERLRQKEAHSADSRAARILAGLGFDEAAQRRPCAEFSGGWRMRVALAGLLFSRPDLLLLDEPTNHLDLEASLWLEDYLRRYPGTVLLVSHDRGLLNRVVGEILHLEGNKLTLYQGGYDRFEQTRRMRLELDEKMRAKQEAERARIQKFVDRFRYKATKARQAQSRLKMLDRMEPLAEVEGDGAIRFEFPEPEHLPPPLCSTEKVVLGYDGVPVLRNVSLYLDSDDRIGLLGANGNGKSTLIRFLAGRLAPISGEVNKSNKLRVGYFAQHQSDELDLDGTPVTELSRKRPRDTEQQLRSHLGRFGFSQERADTCIADLSGGEKARLLFAIMSCEKPQLLLLDEPTNHLDVQSRQALIQALNAFEGAVVIVSHDPSVLELTADRFWLVKDGAVRPFDGTLDDYRSLLLQSDKTGGNGSTTSSAPDRKEQRRQAADRRKALAPLKQKLDQSEKRVAELEAEKSRIQTTLADPALYANDNGRLVELGKRLGQVEKDLTAAEEAWIEVHEEWDRAQSEAE